MSPPGAAWRAVARPAYSLLLWLLQPAFLARLAWRGRAEPPYHDAIGERFGFYRDRPDAGGALWIHAVSLGETRAAAALVDALRAARPGLRLVLTHGTATGREAGAALVRGDAGVGPAGAAGGPAAATRPEAAQGSRDRQYWLPIDTPGAVQRFLRHVRPAAGVLMETEIWPNLIRAAQRQGVPIVLANARLSARSAARGDRLEAVLAPAVEALALVLAQTADDARRLAERGAPRVEVCGNLKFDMAPPPALLEAGARWRRQAREDARPIVLAASTREGEEAALLDLWRRLPASRPRLLLVPRHPQRFDEVAQLVALHGLTLARRSHWGEAARRAAPPSSAPGADVWLGDSLGEMPLYYAAAEVALLGGSFEPLGGQNLIEAAACGCPVVMGPHTFNFDEAATLSLAAGAALRVADLPAGVVAALDLVASGRGEAMGAAALAFAQEHRGAAARMAARILALLPA